MPAPVRKDKKQAAAKQYDNDNLPVDDQLSTVGKTADDTNKKIDGESQAEAAQASGEASQPKRTKNPRTQRQAATVRPTTAAKPKSNA